MDDCKTNIGMRDVYEGRRPMPHKEECVNVRQSEIGSSMEQLSCSITILNNKINDLHSKIDPILFKMPSIDKKAKCTQPSAKCYLATMIDEQIDKIINMTESIEDTMRDIQL